MPLQDELSALWDTVKGTMTDKFPQATIDLWFGCFTLTEYDGRSATLVTDNDFKYKIVRERYIDDVRRYFEQASGYPVEVTLLCSSSGESTTGPSSAAVQSAPEPHIPMQS